MYLTTLRYYSVYALSLWSTISPTGTYLDQTAESEEQTYYVTWKLTLLSRDNEIISCCHDKTAVKIIKSTMGAVGFHTFRLMRGYTLSVRDRQCIPQMYTFQCQRSCRCSFPYASPLCSTLFLSFFWKRIYTLVFKCIPKVCYFMPVSAKAFAESIIWGVLVDCSMFNLSNRPWICCQSAIQMF